MKKFCKTININNNKFNNTLINQIDIIKNRSIKEKLYLENEINIIKSYTKEQAISELIKSQKLSSKKWIMQGQMKFCLAA